MVYDGTFSEAFNSTQIIRETIEGQLNYYKIKQKEKYVNMEAVRKNMYNVPKSPEIPLEDNYEAIHKRNNDIVMMEPTCINSSTTDTMKSFDNTISSSLDTMTRNPITRNKPRGRNILQDLQLKC